MVEFTCLVDGCGAAARTRGMCPKHYQAARRAGALAPRQAQAQRPCSVEDCDSAAFQRELCHKHYRRLRLYGDPLTVKREYHQGGRQCSVERCTQPARARGLCQPHYMRQYRGGEVEVTPKPRRGPVCSVENCGEPHHALGYCATHHARVKRTGEPGAAEKLRQQNVGQCGGPECEQSTHSRGLCPGHYAQQSAGRELTPIVRAPRVPKGTECAVDGCSRPSLTGDGICRTHAEYRRAGLANWRQAIPERAPHGAGHLNEHGYRVITGPDGRPKLEHRHVMELHIGRPLLPTETVHHRKGGFKGRSNNALSNLELWTGRHPSGHRVEDVARYCREMLAVYGDDGERGRYAGHAAAVLADTVG